jgi:hypothetical protein
MQILLAADAGVTDEAIAVFRRGKVTPFSG